MPQFDRTSCSIPKSQIGFYDFFITDMFTMLAGEQFLVIHSFIVSVGTWKLWRWHAKMSNFVICLTANSKLSSRANLAVYDGQISENIASMLLRFYVNTRCAMSPGRLTLEGPSLCTVGMFAPQIESYYSQTCLRNFVWTTKLQICFARHHGLVAWHHCCFPPWESP